MLLSCPTILSFTCLILATFISFYCLEVKSMTGSFDTKYCLKTSILLLLRNTVSAHWYNKWINWWLRECRFHFLFLSVRHTLVSSLPKSVLRHFSAMPSLTTRTESSLQFLSSWPYLSSLFSLVSPTHLAFMRQFLMQPRLATYSL